MSRGREIWTFGWVIPLLFFGGCALWLHAGGLVGEAQEQQRRANAQVVRVHREDVREWNTETGEITKIRCSICLGTGQVHGEPCKVPGCWGGTYTVTSWERAVVVPREQESIYEAVMRAPNFVP
jgi:hypothetical protein